MEEILHSRWTTLKGVSLLKHQPVPHLLYQTKRWNPGETREQFVSPSSCQRIQLFHQFREVVCKTPESKRGYHAETPSWFNEEDVQLRVRGVCASRNESK